MEETVHPRTGRPVTALDFSPVAGSEQLKDRRVDPDRQVGKRRAPGATDIKLWPEARIYNS